MAYVQFVRYIVILFVRFWTEYPAVGNSVARSATWTLHINMSAVKERRRKAYHYWNQCLLWPSQEWHLHNKKGVLRILYGVQTEVVLCNRQASRAIPIISRPPRWPSSGTPESEKLLLRDVFLSHSQTSNLLTLTWSPNCFHSELLTSLLALYDCRFWTSFSHTPSSLQSFRWFPSPVCHLDTCLRFQYIAPRTFSKQLACPKTKAMQPCAHTQLHCLCFSSTAL